MTKYEIKDPEQYTILKNIAGITGSDTLKNCIIGPPMYPHWPNWPGKVTDNTGNLDISKYFEEAKLKEGIMELKQVKNGFTIKYKNEDYVFETVESLCNFIKENFNGTKA